MIENNLESNPADLYEDFLGFPHGGEKNYYDEFYRYCKEKIVFSRDDDLKKINILSIGTGYGRADLPFIKAFIEKNEPMANKFNIYCIDPSEFFEKKLYDNLVNRFEGKFSIFSNISKKEKDDSNNTFSVEGEGITGRSFIKVLFYRKDLKKFLETPELNPIGFHCVISFLSMQFVSGIKMLLPNLLKRLEKRGIVVIGEACKHAAWVSVPPPLIFDEPVKYYCWYKLWSDWHKTLKLKGIIQNLRLFPPHDFNLIFKFFDASKCFSKENPSEFHWEKELTHEIFNKIIKGIENDKFKGIVSSIDLSEFLSENGALGAEKKVSGGGVVLSQLKNDEFIEDKNLYGAWRDWDKERSNLVFINGLRVHIFSKKKNLNKKKYEEIFQQVILKNSFNNLRMSGLVEHLWNEERDSIKHLSVLPEISRSIKQHIEIDKGAYIVPISVRPNSEVIAAISGSLIPASKACIEAGVHNEFFNGFDLLVDKTDDEKKRIISGYWILLYEMSLNLAERQSSTATELQQALNLNPGFDIIVDMDADSEEIIDISRASISFKLQGARFKELRQRIWKIINNNEQIKGKFEQLNKYDKYNKTTVSKQLESFWSERTIEKLYKDGVQESFAPLSFFKPSLDDDIIENLFGSDSFNQIKAELQSLFNGWKKESGIIKKLDEMKKSQQYTYDSERVWTILCQLYKYGIYIYEKDLMNIFHISLPISRRTNVWGAIHFFMHRKEASYFITESLELTDLFYKFVLPFDNLLYREIHSVQIESVGEEKGEKIGQSNLSYTFGHEVKALNTFLTTDYWIKPLDFFFDISNNNEGQEKKHNLQKLGKVVLYEPHEKYRELINLFGAFPFKDFVGNIGRMNNFWGGILSSIDIPVKDKRPEDSSTFILECWKYSVKTFAITIFCKQNIESLKELFFFYDLKKTLDKHLNNKIEINGEKLKIKWEREIPESTEVFSFSEEPSHLNLLAKIFLAMFDNCLMHGELFNPVIVNINRLANKNFFQVSIKNTKDTRSGKGLEETVLRELCSSFKLSKEFYSQSELMSKIDEIIRKGRQRFRIFVFLGEKEEAKDIKTPFVIRYCLRNLNRMDYDEKDYSYKEYPSDEKIYCEGNIRIKLHQEE
jgi:hypothetical protein